MDEIICSECGFTAGKDEADRICSNCFACTGCIRFVCPKCGQEIEVVPTKGFRLKSGNNKK